MGNVPNQRTDHTAVWTGTEMIVWGGDDGGVLLTGGRYYPAGDAWRSTSTGPHTPAARAGHTATWGDSQMFVFGGSWSKFEPGAAYCAESTDVPADAIPAISTWGMLITTLSLLTLGTTVLRSRWSDDGREALG